MNWFNVGLSRIRGLFRREAVLRDVDEEVRLHIDMETEANVRRGMSEADARRAAVRSFGNVGVIKDIAHDIRGGGILESVWHDLRFALRVLIKNPAFTLVAITALALGIGITTIAFSTFNALFLRPMPLTPDQERIVYVSEYLTKLNDQNVGVSFPDYLEWKKQVTTLEVIAAFRGTNVIISGGERPERYYGSNISADAFSFLGVKPILGRVFRSEEDNLDAPPVALIGYELWQTQFGGDPSIVGRAIPINGKQMTVVGVAPRGWHFPDFADLWIPLQLDEKDHPRSEFSVQGFGKLRKGVSLAQARAELEAINGRLAMQYPETNAGRGVHATLLREQATGSLKQPMLLVMGAVLLVQLIACANLANLLLARGATRAQEFAIRLAVGASRAQIARQLLAEAAVIGIAGSALGLMFTAWGADLVRAAFPTKLPYWVLFDLDWRICLFAIATGFVSTLLFGLFPALQASRPHLVADLKEAGRSARGGVKARRVRNSLVIAQIALAMVLLVGASLMLRSLLKLHSTDIGADPSNTLTFRVSLPQVPAPHTSSRFFEQLITQLGDLPGVEAAGASSSLPGMGASRGTLLVEGEPEPANASEGRAMAGITITPGFLRAAGIPLLRGRDFTAADNEDATRVVVIDEEAARLWFPDQDPIGRRVRALDKPGGPASWAKVVGVVRSVVYHRLTGKRRNPAVYFPHAQDAQPFMAVAMRTKADPKAFVNVARQTVLSINKELPIFAIETMDEVLAQRFWLEKFFGSLFSVFAALAVLLASLGLYGVIAYSVRQRTQEIGLRMALGAQASDVFRLVTVQGLRLVAFGLLLGLIGAFFVSRLLAGNVHGISSHDPLSFAVVPLVLLGVGLLASYFPARAAMRLVPMEALRHE